MLNLEQIRNIRFHKARRDGYMPEEVDSFIEEVVATFEAVLSERTAEKNRVKEIETSLAACRARESSVGEALLIAQHQADIIVNEAQSRAELILEEARMQAKEIIGATQMEVEEQKKITDALRQEVSSFKGRLLQLYREHLTLIDAMPDNRSAAKQEQEVPAAQEAAPVEEEVPVAEAPAEVSAEETVAEEAVPSAEEMPVLTSHSQQETEPEMPALFTEDDESEYAAQPASDRFAGLQFGADYEELSDGGLFHRKK